MNPEPQLPLAELARPAPSPWLWRLILLLFSLIGGVLVLMLYLLGPTGVQATLSIERGEGAAEVGRKLQQAGLVRSSRLFILYLRASGHDDELRTGVYRLEGNGVRRLALQLTSQAQPLWVRVTFPEGWRATQMAQRLTEVGLDGASFLQLVQQPQNSPDYAVGPTLEGYLFPATYTFPLDLSAPAILTTLLERFALELRPEIVSQLESLGLTVHDWVTLASIVQAEAANDAEMLPIAGVFLNRLEVGMPLQADPTVAYGLGKTLPQLSRPAGDFQSNTPYNTYRVRGLPPGAISNPGRAALMSVLRAQRTNPQGEKWFYFFHAQKQLFLNVNFASHQRDLAQYR
jgi:UPF0755 protein